MSTPAQVQANRTNALKSTGPRSPEGKSAVAHNARTHGLSGSFSVLAHEDRAEFDSLLEQYRADFQPQSTHEAFLVEEMAQSRWILARARRLEAHVLDQIAGSPVADQADARIAAQLVANSRNAFGTVQRYAATANRAYFHAHRELTQGRAQELPIKANPTQSSVASQPKVTPAQPPQPEVALSPAPNAPNAPVSKTFAAPAGPREAV